MAAVVAAAGAAAMAVEGTGAETTGADAGFSGAGAAGAGMAAGSTGNLRGLRSASIPPPASGLGATAAGFDTRTGRGTSTSANSQCVEKS